MQKEMYCKAMRKDNNKWIEGFLLKQFNRNDELTTRIYQPKAKETFINFEVISQSVCRCSGLTDKDEHIIWENDIYRWTDEAWGYCTGIVKYGEYIQDGSGGEYSGTSCLGFYVEVQSVEPLCPEIETKKDAENSYPDYLRRFSLCEMLKKEHEHKGTSIITDITDESI